VAEQPEPGLLEAGGCGSEWVGAGATDAGRNGHLEQPRLSTPNQFGALIQALVP